MACGLRRRELWVRDRRSRGVLALLWWHPTVGGIAVRQFAYMVGESPPPGVELELLEDLHPGVPQGSEPPCRP
ncbi:hypothetical protein H5V45_20750 [Nocardioides sp. KIGAM211]|uniref:Uncharacterized protein n=1 Tax=Nocardioides luti TaxID=2761101 RepID=A0A7X0VCG4_9ACTN|nr:hypothetical protein [Nocardioides luti]MBB6629759.1 hypothetical protein [Nocardioides luti]